MCVPVTVLVREWKKKEQGKVIEGSYVNCRVNQRKKHLMLRYALGNLPVNIKCGSWRLKGLGEGFWRNVTYVPSCCQLLHELTLVQTLLPLD